MKNVTIDSDTTGDYVAFAQNIDFTELFDHIKAFTKADCAFHQPEITTSRGEVHINFISDDIAAQTGPFAAILERCSLHSFSNGVYTDKETHEPAYWVSVSIQYEHKDGGSNGMNICRASYTELGGWVFRDAGAKR